MVSAKHPVHHVSEATENVFVCFANLDNTFLKIITSLEKKGLILFFIVGDLGRYGGKFG